MLSWVSNLPWSTWWFVLTGLLYLLQLVPFTGVFLMMLAAPLWSVLTINAGFLSLAIEALMGATRRIWLLAPLAWFGGYAVAAQLSDQHYRALDAELRARNAAERIAFDPHRQALVIKPDADQLSGLPASYVQDYRVPVVYEESANFKTASHLARRVGVQPICTTIRSDPSYSAASIHAWGLHERAQGRPKLSGEFCALSMPEDPLVPIVRVEAEKRRQAVDELLVPHWLTRVTISDDRGGVATLTAGHAQPLTWLPQPIMGCALNSSAPSWDCFAGFRRRELGLGGEGGYGRATGQVIATALGLEAAHFTTRRDEIAAYEIPSLDGLVERHTDIALANLEAVLADPTRRISVHDVRGLGEQPALIEPHVPAIIAAMASALDGGRRSHETARVLQGLLVALPEASFRAAGPQLIEVLASRDVIDDDRLTSWMATRLGDLGAEALPLLSRALAGARPALATAVIYGLCRVGPPAAALAPQLRVRATGTRQNRDMATAALVALRRMGRGDLVEPEVVPDGPFSKVSDKVRERAITPDSPPSVCADQHGRPRLPGT